MVIGWRRFPIILGSKIEECAACGFVGEHVLLRETWWFCLFWLPVLLLRFKHSMLCVQCGTATGIPFLQMVRGTMGGSLPLVRPRPRFESLPPDESGFKPTSTQYFDRVTPNPKRTLGAWYFMLWPVLCASLICVVVARSLLVPPLRTPLGQNIDSQAQDKYGAAHDCWLEDDTVVGCELGDGSLMGITSDSLTVCYFDEPLGNQEEFFCRD